MKSLKLALVATAMLATLAACGNKNNNDGQNQNGGNGQVASVPAPECVNPYMQGTYNPGYNPYQNQNWYQYQRAGYYPYQTGYGYGAGYGANGCQPGTFPVCTNGVGLACVPTAYYSNYNVAWYSPYTNGGLRFCGYAGYNDNTSGCGSYQQSFMGPTGFGMSCLVNQPGSCGYGGYCRPLNYNVGVCVR